MQKEREWLSQDPQQPKNTQRIPADTIPAWMPTFSYLLFAAVVLSVLNISNGDPGIILIVGAFAGAMMYAEQIDALLTLPKKTKLYLLAAISLPGTYLMQQIESPAYALFFGGFKTFLNSTLGTFIPASAQFFDIFVALLQFLFVVYMVLRGLKAFRERDNDEEVMNIMRIPITSLITLAVFDFVLIQVIA